MEYYTLFPKLCEEMKPLIPEVYFGGMEVPPYLNIELEKNYTLESLVSTVRSIGDAGNSCGYIDESGIHFHLPGDDINVDLSRTFVFVSQPKLTDRKYPSAWQIFSFLKEPASRALFIGSNYATLIEKSEYTLRLCKYLDEMWAQPLRYLDLVKDMLESEEAREKGLACLMKNYEEETSGSSDEMWDFWDTFGELLMKRSLGLSVHIIQ